MTIEREEVVPSIIAPTSFDSRFRGDLEKSKGMRADQKIAMIQRRPQPHVNIGQKAWLV